MSESELKSALGELMALIVHDLRNPVATVSANVSFVREVSTDHDPDVVEALEDVDLALGELMRGLEHLAWVSRWIAGQHAMEGAEGDARSAVEAGARKASESVELALPSEPVPVRVGGGPLSKLVEIFVRNSLAQSKRGARVSVHDAGTHAVVEITDEGPAVGADLRDRVFTLEGQQLLKGRSDGRYSRAVGLLAAKALADGIGASLEADGADGAAVFRIRLPKA